MAIPFFKEMSIGGYLIKQKLLGRKRYPLVLMLEPLFRCNLAVLGPRQDRLSRRDPQPPHVGAGMLGCGRRMRRADGGDPRRRTVDPQGDRRDRARPGGTQEVRLAVHQRTAAGEEARSVRALALSVLLGASRRPEGPPRQGCVAEGRVRPRCLRDQGREGARLYRQRQRHDLRRPSGGRDRKIPRLHDRTRCRRLDVAGLRL